jgi:amino acid adenylation domain-containing protein/non-ribosomal peptide synthase protein (TIGR01720 family)
MTVENIEDLYELSPLQQGMLFHTLYAPEAGLYFVHVSCALHGDLDIPAFEQACRLVVDRHPVLRTSFHWEDLDKPLQAVHRHVQLPLEQHDWRGLPAGEQQSRLTAYLRADRQRGFELAQAPVMRLALVRMTEHLYHFIWSSHHLLLDGWSHTLIFKEVFDYYESFRQGRALQLAHSRPYGDYIAWVQQQDLSEAEAFWRQALAGFSAPTRLGLDHAPDSLPDRQEHYNEQHVRLSPATTTALQLFARQHQLTLNTLALGAWALLLSHYSGEDDVLFGATSSGRPANLAGVESMAGLFINTLPVRVRMTPQTSLLPWLKQLQVQQAELRQYEYSPLVQVQGWSEVPRGQPLFESILVFENYPLGASTQARGSTMEIHDIRYDAWTNYPLTVQVAPEARLLLQIAYDCRRFDDATITRMLGHLQTVLAAMLADPTQRLAEVPFLADSERQQLLVTWNTTQVAYPQNVSLHLLFAAQAARTPDAIAVVFDERPTTDYRPPTIDRRPPAHSIPLARRSTQCLTYGELDRRANQLAHYLRSLGVGPETLVGLCLERSLEMVIGLLGVLKAGGAYVPLDPSYPPERIQYMLEDAQVAVLLTTQEQRTTERKGVLHTPPVDDERANSTLPQQTVIDLISDWPIIAQEPATNLDGEAMPDHLAYVIYTSGSTGRPKGTMISHRAICNHMLAMQAAYPLNESDRVLQKTAFSFDASVTEFFLALLAGAQLVMACPGGHQETAYLVEVIARQQVTTLVVVPSLLQVLLQEPGIAMCRGLRHVFCGGEALSFELQTRFFEHLDADLHNSYGPTEAAVDVAFWTLKPDSDQGSIPIGRPIANTQIYLLNAQLQLVPLGVPGELHIGGVGLARGYLKRPDLTAERFIPNPFADHRPPTTDHRPPTIDEAKTQNSRLYKTGDLARYRPDGTIEYLGRLDFQVKVRGFRIELGEIEAALSAHPHVREAAVVVREDVPGDRRLIAYIVLGQEQRTTLRVPDKEQRGEEAHSQFSILNSQFSELRDYLKTRLPNYMIPSAFVALDALPLTPNGKLNRRALPAPTARPDLDEAFVAPRTPEEIMLAELWSQVLGVAQVGIHDNFFALGGDSILSIQVTARAAQAGLYLTPRQLFQHPTIAALAALTDRPAVVVADQEAVSGPVPLTPIQHWFFEQHLPNPHHWNQALLLQEQEPLDVELLEQVVGHVFGHHDALRLRFVQEATGWRQINAGPEQVPPFTRIDLSHLPDDQLGAAIEAAAAELQASLNLSEGPLARVAYFDHGPYSRSRLLLVIHHLAIDSVSWRVLIEDLQTAYAEFSQGGVVTLPSKTTSFKQWAERLAAHARSGTLRHELPYWLGIGRIPIASLPVDYVGGVNTEASARTVAVALSADETRALLQEVPAIYRTQINDVLLTALVLAFARWAGARSLLIDLEGHGREALFDDVDLSRTVGWFTTIFPVFLDLEGAADHPGAALKAIREQLRRIPNRGIGYGLLRYLSGDTDVAQQLRALPQAEVSFNYVGQFDQVLAESALFEPAEESAGPTRGEGGRRSHLLDVNGLIVGGRLYVEWTYSEKLHQRATVERLAQHFIEALRSLIAHCQSPEAEDDTWPDFPLARLDERTLNRLAALIGSTVRSEVEDVYPLSPMQQGMLFHTLYAPASGVYVGQIHCILQGDLDISAFQRAWQQVEDRHPILRTLFVWEGLDEPLQVVRRHVDLPLEQYDWRGVAQTEQQLRLGTYLQTDRQRSFEPAVAPLMRLALFRVSEDTCHFIWTTHHLLLDGWSTFLVLKEVFAYYDVYSGGQGLRLERGQHYREYIAWLQRQDIAQAEAFWRQALRGFPAPTPLGVDHGPDNLSAQDEDAVEQHIQLSKATTAALQSLARQQHLTLNTLVQAAWALLLSRYSGETDVVFGVTSSGRPPDLAGSEFMVGLFINTLPVRVRVDLEGSPLPWMQQLQAQQAEARQYEYSPLVQIQSWSEVPRGLPLFESILVFENYPVDTALREWRGSLAVRQVRFVSKANYPLLVGAAPGPALSLRIAYDPGRFDAATITRMLGHLRTILEGIAANPEQPLADVPFLTEAEQQQLLVTWNATYVDTSIDTCIHELFEAQAEHSPDAVALVFEDQCLTYGSLNGRANQVAHHLRTLGVGPEVPVGICIERSPEMIVALLGTLKAGAAYVGLEPTLPQERLAFMLEDAQVPVLITTTSDERRPTTDDQSSHINPPSSILHPPSSIQAVVDLRADWNLIAQESTENSRTGVTVDNLAYIIYTSGSTGRPKGVAGAHRQLLSYLSGIQEPLDVPAGASFAMLQNLSVDAPITFIYAALCKGGVLHVLSEKRIADPEALGAYFRRQHIDYFKIAPSYLASLLASSHPQHVLPRRLLLVGGEASHWDLVRTVHSLAPDCAFVNHYGPTETTCGVATYRVENSSIGNDAGALPLGSPIAGAQIYVLDTRLRPVPIGVPGELYIGGPGVSRGYLNRPDLTAERFVPNPFETTDPSTSLRAGDRRPTTDGGQTAGSGGRWSVVGGRLYRTGDMARYLPDGNIAFMGRIDHQVKIRGFRIELGEIEVVLGQHPSVRSAVVVAREDGSGDKRLIAYIVPTTDHRPPTTDAHAESSVVGGQWSVVGELRAFLKERLPEYMLPAAIVLLQTLPRTPQGKVDRRALPAPDGLRPDLEATYVAPQTEAERIIAGVWQEVLHIERAGIHDNFFDLGGHSLLMIQVHTKLREMLDSAVSMVDLFRYPTIGALATFVSRERDERPDFQPSQERAATRREAARRQKERRQQHRAAQQQTGDQDE